MTDFEDITPASMTDKLVVKLYRDEDTENPRASFDHAGTLYFNSSVDFDLSDKNADLPARSRNRYADDIEVAARWISFKGGVCLPVCLDDYGSWGATVYGSDVDDANGLFFMLADKIAEEFPPVAPNAPAEYIGGRGGALRCLQSELEELSQYLAGDVFGYVIETLDGNHEDSCWGFYGETYATEAAHEAAAHVLESLDDRAAANLAARQWGFTRLFGATV